MSNYKHLLLDHTDTHYYSYIELSNCCHRNLAYILKKTTQINNGRINV